MSHGMIVLSKVGESTGRKLHMASCECGWRASIWYASEGLVASSHAAHVRAVESGSTVPWMIAPRRTA